MGLCASAELSAEQQAQVDAAKSPLFSSFTFCPIFPLLFRLLMGCVRERSRALDKDMQAQDQADAQVKSFFSFFFWLLTSHTGEQIITAWGW